MASGKTPDPELSGAGGAPGTLGAALARLRAGLARSGPRPRRLKVGYNSAALLIEQAEEAAQRRKPPEAGLSEPAIPPEGPLPKQGGAAVPLDFEAD